MAPSAQSADARVVPHLGEVEGASVGIKYPTFIVLAVVLMLVFVAYVGSHIRMTELEYNIAAEISTQEKILEEPKKLKLEYAMLKSPQRIENLVRDRLQMSYPDNEQVIVIRKSGG